MELLGLIFFVGIVGVVMLVAIPMYTIYNVVKMVRARNWYQQHKIPIGSDEYYRWCNEHGVNPSRYI